MIGLVCVYCSHVFYVNEGDVEVTGEATTAIAKVTLGCVCNKVYHPGRMLPIFKGEEAEDEPQTDSVGS
jgi:hypothetical protein